MRDHEEILSCLREKSVEELSSYAFKGTPTFLTAMGPSRDGVVIPGNDDDDRSEFMAAPENSVKRKSSARKSNYSLLIGTVEDEVSHMFGDFQVCDSLSTTLMYCQYLDY